MDMNLLRTIEQTIRFSNVKNFDQIVHSELENMIFNVLDDKEYCLENPLIEREFLSIVYDNRCYTTFNRYIKENPLKFKDFENKILEV